MTANERFEQLWTNYLEGELDPAGFAELNALLEANPGLVQEAASSFQTHRLLGRALQPEEEGAFIRDTLARLQADRESFVGGVMDKLGGPMDGGTPWWLGWFQPAWLRYAVAAGLIVCATLLADRLLRRSPAPGQAPLAVVNNASSDLSVATLLFADDCRWRDAGEAPQEGQRLFAGRLQLAQGLALLRFDSGAAAILTGNVELEIESRGSARLHRGKLTVRAPEQATGFTVRTPAGEMVDLGTEFAVKVEPSGNTELHVLEGAVERREPDQPARLGVVITTGNAQRYERTNAFGSRPVPLAAPRFGELLRQAQHAWGKNAPLVYEGFHYHLGLRQVDTADGGFGWAGPWRLRRSEEVRAGEPDETSDILIVERDFDAPWLPPIRGGMWETPPGHTYRLRPLSVPLDLGADAIYYVSLITRAEPVADRAQQFGKWGNTRITFRCATNYWQDRIGFGIDAQSRPQILFRDGVSFAGPPAAPLGQLQFWVGKIAARRNGEDEVAFKIYDAIEAADPAEPAQWTVVSRGIRSDARLDLVVLSAIGAGCHWFDELRISRSWRSVVPVAPPLNTLAGPP